MRNFLNDIHIVGSTRVWSEGELCRAGIESLLKYCDKVFITLDNPDVETRSIVNGYKLQYPDSIITVESGIPAVLDGEKVMSRWKRYAGELQQVGFDAIRQYHEQVKKVDLLLYLDSDELFCDGIGDLLTQFWNSSVDVIFIKPFEVYDCMQVLVSDGLIAHARVYRYNPELSAIPYAQQDFFNPYRKSRNIWKKPWNYVHTYRLNKAFRDKRMSMRGERTDPEMKLQRVSKPANQLTPEEGNQIYASRKFIRFKDWDGRIDSVPLIL